MSRAKQSGGFGNNVICLLPVAYCLRYGAYHVFAGGSAWLSYCLLYGGQRNENGVINGAHYGCPLTFQNTDNTDDIIAHTHLLTYRIYAVE